MEFLFLWILKGMTVALGNYLFKKIVALIRVHKRKQKKTALQSKKAVRQKH